MLNEQATKILCDERKLDEELLAKLGVKSIAQRDGFEQVSIPYFIGNDVVNYKHRTISGEKRFSQDPNGKKCFWNLNALLDASLRSEPLIITEGEFDCIAALQSGFQRSVSVPDGAPAKKLDAQETQKYSYLDDAIKLFTNEKQIILAFDNDGPGSNLLHDISLRLGRTRCKWVKYPEGCKDLNDVLKHHGEEGIRECISRADWVRSDGVYKVSQLPPIEEKEIYLMNWKPLDEHYKLRLGDLVVMTGIPSHGKTTAVNEIACRMALQNHWRISFASFEQTPQTDHRRNLRSWYLKKLVVNADEDEIAKADEWIDQHFRFIVAGDDDMPNLEWFLEKISISAIQHECQMIVLDPWNELDHCRDREMSLTEYTGHAIKQFKRLAKMLNIHLIILAHPAKMQRSDGKYLPPSLYDISDSAHWANKADIGITIFRPDLTENETHFIVGKQRYQPTTGVPGMVKLHYLADMRRFEVTEEPQKEGRTLTAVN